MPRPAHELLHPDCPVKPAWAVFDAGWYLHHYADARALCAGKPPLAALLYYLRVGARMGHCPSPLFDEIYYLTTYPDVAELVKAGHYASGFDHYCQHGWRGSSPHWLFDDTLYDEAHDDMSLENLERHDIFGRYDHYLKSGQRERRMAHFLFDSQYYRQQAIEAGYDEAEIEALGPYVHCLAHMGTKPDEPAPSLYFDPAWYLAQYPAVAQEIIRGRYRSALHHYITTPTPELSDPVLQFSERFYRQRYPDIAAAIQAGFYRTGYQQFVQHGCYELRQPCADIDLAYYRDANPCVRDSIAQGHVRDAFAHLRSIGLSQGLDYSPPLQMPILEEYPAREAFIRQAKTNLALFARQTLDFSYPGKPALSVVMVLHNRFELTMRALVSLRQTYAGGIQLILVDNGSEDSTRNLETYVKNITLIKNAENVGFLQAANQGLEAVKANAMLYLNNDVELGYGAIEAALSRLNAAKDIGAVCGKIIRTHGRLQEAGSIIWRDGTTTGYMRDAAPLASAVQFVREVDYGSAVFLLCRTALIQTLGGFDDAFRPAYYEDADLCVRILQAGYRIIYDPLVSLTHLEFGSAVTSEASMALMRRGRRIFTAKHQAFLQTQHPKEEGQELYARTRDPRKTVLFIEDTVPLRRLGSGFVRANDIVHAIDAAGYNVHVFPINGAPYDIMSLLGDMPERTEILYDRDFTWLDMVLAERKDLYDTIWVSRTHNLHRIQPLLQKHNITAKLVLDTEALACQRAAQQAAKRHEAFDFTHALAEEFANLSPPDTILAVTKAEVDLLKAAGQKRVTHLGTARDITPTTAPFSARTGLLFIGAIHQQGAPNEESLSFYKDEIYPHLKPLLPHAPPLTVIGHEAAGVDLSALTGTPALEMLGEVMDTSTSYQKARVFVAPTRFAAGAPYKIYEAAAMGVPCVVTTLLAYQLGWQTEEELLAVPEDNPQAFAHAIARLYQDEALWHKLRSNALARMQAENSMKAFRQQVKSILRAL